MSRRSGGRFGDHHESVSWVPRFIGERLMLVEYLPVMVCDRDGEETLNYETIERVRV